MVIWMTHYSMDYWETKLAFCEVLTVAFFLCILGGEKKEKNKVKQHFSVNSLQPTLTYIHNVRGYNNIIVNVRSNLLPYFCQII